MLEELEECASVLEECAINLPVVLIEKLIKSLYDTLRFDYNKNKEEYWSLKQF